MNLHASHRDKMKLKALKKYSTQKLVSLFLKATKPLQHTVSATTAIFCHLLS